MISFVLFIFRKSSRLQREGNASSGKQQAGAVLYSVHLQSVWIIKKLVFNSVHYTNRCVLLLVHKMFQMR